MTVADWMATLIVGDVREMVLRLSLWTRLRNPSFFLIFSLAQSSTVDYLAWRWFGRNEEWKMLDICERQSTLVNWGEKEEKIFGNGLLVISDSQSEGDNISISRLKSLSSPHRIEVNGIYLQQPLCGHIAISLRRMAHPDTGRQCL